MSCSLKGLHSTANLRNDLYSQSHLRSTFLQQLDEDDDNGSFTASDERFEQLIICTAEYNSEAARPGIKPLERGQFAEKMARETNSGTLLRIFNFYAKLFAPHQQMQAKVPTYSEIMFANNTLSQGEIMCFCTDFRIVPHLLTRNDIRNIWPFIGEELESETKRVGKELSFAGFMEFLVCFLINIIYKCLCFIILSPILTLYFYINSFCSSSSFYIRYAYRY
jgi:hypothetical protein